MVRKIYDKIDVVIPVGSRSFSISQTLKKGTCVGVKGLHVSSATAIAQGVNINVTDGNNTILGATDFRDYVNNGGGYEGNFKPCHFDSSLEITVDALSESNILTGDFKMQLVFMIEIEC